MVKVVPNEQNPLCINCQPVENLVEYERNFQLILITLFYLLLREESKT